MTPFGGRHVPRGRRAARPFLPSRPWGFAFGYCLTCKNGVRKPPGSRSADRAPSGGLPHLAKHRIVSSGRFPRCRAAEQARTGLAEQARCDMLVTLNRSEASRKLHFEKLGAERTALRPGWMTPLRVEAGRPAVPAARASGDRAVPAACASGDRAVPAACASGDPG